MPRPEPWSGPIYLRPATPDSTGTMARNDLSVPVTDTIRTDRTGNGYRTLKPGTYLLLDQDHVDDRRSQQLLKDHAKPALDTNPLDKACLDRWLYGPYGVMTIAVAIPRMWTFPCSTNVRGTTRRACTTTGRCHREHSGATLSATR